MTDKEYFCTAPWTSLYLEPNGDVKLCCISKDSIGNVHDESIESIIAGDRVKDIKKNMLVNRPVDSCQNCWRQEPTKRLQNFFNTRYLDPDRHADLDGDWYSDINNFRPKYLDLRWNNTCNFACIYCSPGLSSLWAEIEQNKQLGHPIPIKPSRETKQRLLTWALENLRELDWVYLAGGEPLMVKENLVLLQQLYDVNPDCHLLVNSNLSQLKGNEIFQTIKRFRRVQWMISGESTGAQYEYTRWPGKWKIFYQNIHTVKELEAQGHSISFHLVAMNLNCLGMWDYIDLLLNEQLALEDNNITISLYNNRDSRHQYAIQRLPHTLKSRVLSRIETDRYARIHGFQNFVDALDDPPPTEESALEGLELTFRSLALLDSVRGLDSSLVFPEIYEFFHNQPKIHT